MVALGLSKWTSSAPHVMVICLKPCPIECCCCAHLNADIVPGVAESPNLALIQCADLVVLLRLTSRLWRATAVMLIRLDARAKYDISYFHPQNMLSPHAAYVVSRKHARCAPVGHRLSPQQTLSRMKRAIQMCLLEEWHCQDWQLRRIPQQRNVNDNLFFAQRRVLKRTSKYSC